jgi:hypothetical protein
MFNASGADRTSALWIISGMRRIYVPGPVEGAENDGQFLT